MKIGFQGFRHHDLRIGSQEIVGGVEAGPAEDRVENPPGADRGLHMSRRDAAAHQYQRHPHHTLIEQIPMQKLAVIAEPLAVIADHQDPRVCTLASLFEGLDQSPQLPVHIGDLSEIRG